MDLENIKESTKDAIIQNFMENVKHARRGASHQRPKSWSKGTKSGSDKRKMREEGKRQTREMNEQSYSTNMEWDKDKGPFEHHPEVNKMGRRISNAVHDFASEMELHKVFGHTEEDMRKNLEKNIEDNYASELVPTTSSTSWNDKDINRATRRAAEHFVSTYPAPKGVNPEKWLNDFHQGVKAWTQPNLRGKELEKTLEGNMFTTIHGKQIKFAPSTQTGDLSESLYIRLRKRLAETSLLMGWHDRDPETEGADIEKHTASLSPEERDPFHLVSGEEREDMHKTLESNPDQGSHLVRAGVLGRISQIARMAADTKSYGDDPKAMARIGQLVDYANKAIDQSTRNVSMGSNRDIPR